MIMGIMALSLLSVSSARKVYPISVPGDKPFRARVSSLQRGQVGVLGGVVEHRREVVVVEPGR